MAPPADIQQIARTTRNGDHNLNMENEEYNPTEYNPAEHNPAESPVEEQIVYNAEATASRFSITPDFNPLAQDLFSQPQIHTNNRWSVSWADLMMTMFIFFTVLYVYMVGNRDLNYGTGPGRSQISDAGSGGIVNMNLNQHPSDIYNLTKQAIMDKFVDDTVTVDMISDQAIRISLAGDILFDTGRAELKPQSRGNLRQVASLLQTNNYIINVVGHTDNMPNHSAAYPTNWELSAARALKTTRFLIEEMGVAADRFFVSAHAWHQPVSQNNTASTRLLNRRVEIILTKQRPYPAQKTEMVSDNG